MTMPMLRVTHGRINEIQAQFRRNMPATSSFADTLKAAEADVAPKTAYVVEAMAMPSTSPTAVLPFGILGTPITLTGTSLTGAISGDWRDSLPPAGRQWADEIETAANGAGLDPRLLAAMIWQESGFDPGAVSPSGAIGLTQLMPATAAGLDVDPASSIENLAGGARYLSWAIDEFGSIELGLAAYNAGPNRVREAGGIPEIPETRAYVPAVLDYYRQLGGVA
jgi:soluble lytic murein transglycosylase-like protein